MQKKTKQDSKTRRLIRQIDRKADSTTAQRAYSIPPTLTDGEKTT